MYGSKIRGGRKHFEIENHVYDIRGTSFRENLAKRN